VICGLNGVTGNTLGELVVNGVMSLVKVNFDAAGEGGYSTYSPEAAGWGWLVPGG
jgi:hypothetical protein